MLGVRMDTRDGKSQVSSSYLADVLRSLQYERELPLQWMTQGVNMYFR